MNLLHLKSKALYHCVSAKVSFHLICVLIQNEAVLKEFDLSVYLHFLYFSTLVGPQIYFFCLQSDQAGC